MAASSDSGGPALAAVIEYLRDQRGVDFSGYRPTTLGRRVQQAMSRVDVADLETYLDHLQANPASLDALLDALLINVTSFFRDAEVWQDLRTTILPAALERRPNRPLRVWSSGCATGEEAYTLAIVLAELVGREQLRERVKIYATDVDTRALATARRATYPDRVVAEIAEPLRLRYLEKVDDDQWRVQGDLRRAVVFGRNDIVQDAPISRIDLLVCRNTLMYFTADTQARILDRLHFATATGGILMLGRAETALGHQGLFSPLEGHRRFFRKEELTDGRPRQSLDMTGMGLDDKPSEIERLHGEAMRTAPMAQLIISRSGRLTFANGQAMQLLPLSDKDLGRLLQDTEVSYRPADLRSLMIQVRTNLHSAVQPDVHWTPTTGQEVVFDVHANPLTDPEGTFIGTAVTYLDVSERAEMRRELADLRELLQASYQDVQATTEELETTNEELQSTVEELETTNEELQSTNEELETTNEELRAVNEELYARGAEEHAATADAEDLNKILDTVMDGLGTGVIVVDQDLRVLIWTKTTQELWGLRADEVVGRSLEALDIGLDPAYLARHARALLPDKNTPNGGPRTKRAAEWVDAVNRRGKSIRLRLTAQPVLLHGDLPRIIITIEPAGPTLAELDGHSPSAKDAVDRRS